MVKVLGNKDGGEVKVSSTSSKKSVAKPAVMEAKAAEPVAPVNTVAPAVEVPVTPITKETPSMQKPQSAATILDLMGSFNSPSRLAEPARRYADDIANEVGKNNKTISMVNVSLDTLDTRAFVCGDACVLLMFSETYSPFEPSLPPTIKSEEVFTRLKSIRPEVQVCLETIVVTAKDYGRGTRMSSHIESVFKVYNSPNALLTTDYIKNVRFIVSTNIAQVRNYIDTRSPHEMPVRDDIGFLVYAVNPNVNHNIQFRNLTEDQVTPIFAVTGYTEFMSTSGAGHYGYGVQGGVKFAPIVTITNIVSDLTSSKLLPMAYAMATRVFINGWRWLQPYSIYDNDSPNLGALLTDPATNKPIHVTNVQERDGIIRDHLLNAYLAIDVTDGRARIPGLDRLIHNNLKFIEDTEVFLDENFEDKTSAVAKVWTDYVGTANYNGVEVDVRYLDYLRLATKIKNVSTINKMLFHGDDPKERLGHLREVLGDDKVNNPLYTNRRAVITSAFVNTVVNVLDAKKVLRFEYAEQFNEVNSIADLLSMNANSFNVGISMNDQWRSTPGYNSGMRYF